MTCLHHLKGRFCHLCAHSFKECTTSLQAQNRVLQEGTLRRWLMEKSICYMKYSSKDRLWKEAEELGEGGAQTSTHAHTYAHTLV